MTSKQSILLASGSPRRRELLQQLDVTFTVSAANIDESIIPAETTEKYVLRMAREKALAGLEQKYQQLKGDYDSKAGQLTSLEGNIEAGKSARANLKTKYNA